MESIPQRKMYKDIEHGDSTQNIEYKLHRRWCQKYEELGVQSTQKTWYKVHITGSTKYTEEDAQSIRFGNTWHIEYGVERTQNKEFTVKEKKGISEPINMGSSFEDFDEWISNMKAVHNLEKWFSRFFDWQQQSWNKYAYDLCAREGEIPPKLWQAANNPIGKCSIGSFIVRMWHLVIK